MQSNTISEPTKKLTIADVQWYCYFCKQIMNRSSKYYHLDSNKHKKNTEFLQYERITDEDLGLLLQTQGMSSYDIYQKYGVQVDRKVRELKKKIQQQIN